MPNAIHFGAYPIRPFKEATIDNHFDAETEHPVVLPTRSFAGRAAVVSGSWACWGPADQESDGDESLHIVVILGSSERVRAELAEELRWELLDLAGEDTRLLDYAVVTEAEDWSEVTGVITFQGSDTYVYPVTL